MKKENVAIYKLLFFISVIMLSFLANMVFEQEIRASEIIIIVLLINLFWYLVIEKNIKLDEEEQKP